jgi:hypothetical protein
MENGVLVFMLAVTLLGNVAIGTSRMYLLIERRCVGRTVSREALTIAGHLFWVMSSALFLGLFLGLVGRIP